MNWYKKANIKNESLNLLKELDSEIVEHVNVEGYDLILTAGPQYFHDFDNSPYMYQLAIQKEDSDFTSIEQQFEKKPFTQMPNLTTLIDTLKSTISGWIQNYGRLYLGSFNEARNPKYMNILRYLGYSPKEIPKEIGFSAMYIE